MRRQNRKCLCSDCKLKNRCGENAYNYNHKLTEEERKSNRLSDLKYIRWSNIVGFLSKNICAVSGKFTLKGHRHHLFSWKSHPEMRYFVWNAVYLSPKEHYLFHALYGRNDFTYENFKSFYTQRTGKDFYIFTYNNLVFDFILENEEVKETRQIPIGLQYHPISEKDLKADPNKINYEILKKCDLLHLLEE